MPVPDAVRSVSGAGCSSCDGRCCYDVLVGITAYDAWRIARAQGLRFEEFVTVAACEPGDLGAFRLSDGFAALVLGKNPLQERACAFLMHFANGERRCGTHPSRPRVCRIYPTTLENERVVVRSDVACLPEARRPTALEESAWRRELTAYDFEWEIYSRTIAAWDASALDGLVAYFDFQGRAFDAIDALRATYAAADYDSLIAAHHASGSASDPKGGVPARFFAECEHRARRILRETAAPPAAPVSGR